MKKKPYIFLFVLFVILFFIIGVRYGQKVEQANKTISSYLSLPPTKPIEPTRSSEFETYSHKACGISFLHPAWLTKSAETTTSAQFSEKGKVILSLTCDKKSVPPPSTKPDMTFFQKIDNTGKKTISFTLEKSILPLIEKTIEFITPTP